MKEIYEPSSIEICSKCIDIRATWSPDEERRRRGVPKEEEQWRPPGCDRALSVRVSSRRENQ